MKAVSLASGLGHEGPHEAGWLTLEIAKARNIHGVTPRWHLDASIHHTLAWYRRQAAGEPARTLCEEDLAAFTATA